MRLAPRRRTPWIWLVVAGVVLALLAAAALASPRVLEFTPSAHSRHVSSMSPFRLHFSRPMDQASVELRLSVEPSTPGRVEWEGTTLSFYPLQPWPADHPVQVQLASLARSAQWLPMLTGMTWTFQVDSPRVLYLWPANDTAQLYALDPGTGSREFLAGAEAGVLDYAVGARGEQVVYAAVRADGGVDLRRLDLASGEDTLEFACPEGIPCQALDLDPDGARLAFERSSWVAGAGGRQIPGPRQVWELELTRQAEPTLLGPAEHDTSAPIWSPAGLLAFYDSDLRSMTVVDSRQGVPINQLPNELGLPGDWTPDGESLVLANMLFQEAGADSPATEGGAEFYSHLFAFDVLTAAARDLSQEGGGPVEDASPSTSPDGHWIAFARKYLDDRWTPGRQVWVMQPDGSRARPLTADPDFNHSGLNWSPDSTSLVYVRVNQTSLLASPEIWLVELDQGQPRLLIAGAYTPRWIP
jgi:Tol biopolymer transport system component